MRRFRPLLVVLALAVLALLARLWDVQVVQHDVWVAESVNLVRSQSIEPYVRGAIRDRHGRLIAHDEELYTLDFVWREFRRGHPLGQVAMMRSLAQRRPVGLDETSGDLKLLKKLAVAFASLSPRKLEDFGKGAALELPDDDYVPWIAVDGGGDSQRELDRKREARARRDDRPARAGDIGFYVMRLLDLTPREQREVRDLIGKEGGEERSFLDLAGEATGRETGEVEANLRDRVGRASERLAQLAELIEFDDAEASGEGSSEKLARLVAIIEERRSEVENESADQLFRIATGFSPLRLSKENLGRFDLDWLAAALDWDEKRLEDWQESREEIFSTEALAWMANHTIARSKIDSGGAGAGKPEDRLLSAIAHTFRADPDAWARKSAAPEDWREVEELEVLATLHDRLDGGESIEDDCRAPVFCFQKSEAQSSPEQSRDLLDKALEETFPDGTVQDTLRKTLFELANPRRRSRDPGDPALEEIFSDEDVRATLRTALIELANPRRRSWDPKRQELMSEALSRMNETLQGRIDEVLSLAAGDGAQVRIREEHVEKAKETRRYVVRDRGARSRTIGKEPSIDVVFLVTRYPKAFAGFRATPRTKRVLDAMGPDGVTPLASRLIGKVRSPYLVDVLADRPRLEELASLRKRIDLPETDRELFLERIDDSHQLGESVGGSGLEAWLDEELKGRSGVLVKLGLQDQGAGDRRWIDRGAVDGQDVILTLDLDLQRAAEQVLRAPQDPGNDPKIDPLWYERPIGAIVLATVEGEILAAASWPAEPDKREDFLAKKLDGERRDARERTLGRSTGITPGSVVKPLLAAYAQEYLGLDPISATYHCVSGLPRRGTFSPWKQKDLERRPSGWGNVNCHSSRGHTLDNPKGIAMEDALWKSCNTYFAGLAEQRFTGEQMREVYHMFGFDRPTGVRWRSEDGRVGIVDDFGGGTKFFRREGSEEPGPIARQYLGNGLVNINCNPVQVARAYAGLATGSLPSMTLVREASGEEIPREAEPIAISEGNLDRVRKALRLVVTRGSGVAAGLSDDELGFEFACKTGSADYEKRKIPRSRTSDLNQEDGWKEGMRKHAWIGGWFPFEEPRYVISVLCHDTSATASHSAIHVAAQFLKTAEVKALMTEQR